MALFKEKVKYTILEGPGLYDFQQHFFNRFQRNAQPLFFTIDLNNQKSGILKIGKVKSIFRIYSLALEDETGEKFLFQGEHVTGNIPYQRVAGFYDAKRATGYLHHLDYYVWANNV